MLLKLLFITILPCVNNLKITNLPTLKFISIKFIYSIPTGCPTHLIIYTFQNTPLSWYEINILNSNTKSVHRSRFKAFVNYISPRALCPVFPLFANSNSIFKITDCLFTFLCLYWMRCLFQLGLRGRFVFPSVVHKMEAGEGDGSSK